MAWFARLSKAAAHLTGTPAAFLAAAAMVAVWLISGPLFGFSDTWQLVINTTTTIITFLMVFLIQSTQNQDTVAIQIKLDELIRSNDAAHNALMDLEELSDAELQTIRQSYEQLAQAARHELRGRDGEPAGPVPH
ncbi:MAG TPA: low affinity iron permease family protein [Planctomycetaceae bacterium]|nr:low affinity iron permease family protein [Planctomycetaceae bacterium]